MRKLILQTLTLTNFKGRTFTLEAHGKNLDVCGDNATGKTTLYDGLCWLLFGKDSSFKADFEIKNLSVVGAPVHNLCHEVKGLFKYEGKVIELKKVYQETWTRKRGAATKEMTGHTTDHYIDSVPKSKKEYQEYVSGIATEEDFKLLTSPFYFSEVMKPADRRAFLMSLAHDIPDADVIASNPALAPLSEILATRSIEDHRKVIAANRKEINEKLLLVPVRIDEVVKGMADVAGIFVLEEQDNIAEWSAELDKIETSLAGMKNNGALLELQRDLATADTEVITAANGITQRYNAAQDVTRVKVRALKDRLANIDATVLNNRNDIERRQEDQAFLERCLQRLRDEYAELIQKDEAFKASLAGLVCCEACGQALPADQVEEVKARHNEALADGVATIRRNGTAKVAQVEEVKAKIAVLEAANVELEAQDVPLAGELSRLEASLQDPDGNILVLMMDADPDMEAAATKKKLILDRIELEKAGVADDSKLSEYEIRKQILVGKIEEAKAKIALVEAAKNGVARKAELEKERAGLVEAFDALERDLFLLDEFTRAKVALVENDINGLFKLAKFKLFEEQINGGLSPCCKTTYNGVPFETSLNNGARINVGLDIIDTVSRVKGFSPCIFIDNAESVTELIPIEAQVIRLVVSEADKTLRLAIAA